MVYVKTYQVVIKRFRNYLFHLTANTVKKIEFPGKYGHRPEALVFFENTVSCAVTALYGSYIHEERLGTNFKLRMMHRRSFIDSKSGTAFRREG